MKLNLIKVFNYLNSLKRWYIADVKKRVLEENRKSYKLLVKKKKSRTSLILQCFFIHETVDYVCLKLYIYSLLVKTRTTTKQ